METHQNKACSCIPDGLRGAAMGPAPLVSRSPLARYVAGMGTLFAVWWLFYRELEPLAGFVTGVLSGWMGFSTEGHLGSAISFFVFETPKVLLLLTLVVFVVGIVRSFFTPERTRAILAGRSASIGTVLAALLGIVTPFCSCSAVPLFLGFVTAGVPLGVTFSFLVSAPMVNEIALVLLYGLFGWEIAALYMGTGLAVAMVSGWVIGRLNMERHLEDWVREIQADTVAGGGGPKDWVERIRYGAEAVRDILGRVWMYIIVGIAVGAGIHGYVPEGLMASFMGKSAWWSVPVSVVIGIPMYSNAAGIIPIVQALLEKGAALGTVLAFMMSVIALSLPEMIILRKVLKPRLLGTFVGVVGAGILLVGYVFNVLF